MEFNEYLQLKGYSSKSIATIEKKTSYFKSWCATENITDEAEAGHNDIIAYIKHCRDKGVSYKTAANYISHVKKYYDYLVKVDIVKENPCSNIHIKGIKRKILYDIIPFEQLEKLYHNYITQAAHNWFGLTRKRNKIILGLLIYQGLQSEELMKLEVQDLQLREGNITIHGGRRSASRIMKLETGQAFELMDYINDTRKGLLHHTKQMPQDTTVLFITALKGGRIG